ncbi:hypothetical protein QUC31_005158, partial [Theobroma cacao]
AFEDSFIQPRRVMNGKLSLDLIRRTHHGVTIMLDYGQDVQGMVKEILENLKKVKGQVRGQALKELRQVVQAHGITKKTVVACGGVGLISSLLGPFTTHAVGSKVVGVLVNLNLDFDSKSDLLQPTKISLMVDILNERSIETKINCTRLIGMLMEGNNYASENVTSLSLLVGLLRLVKDKKRLNGLRYGYSQQPVSRLEDLKIAKRAIELAEHRLPKDEWPEYHDGKSGSYVGKQARKYQTWSVSSYLVAKMMIEILVKLAKKYLQKDE